MAADIWTFWVSALLLCTYGRANGFLDNLNHNQCDVDVWPQLSDPNVINKQIPDSCTAGAFRWDYPQNTVHLHFPNPSGQQMSVCIRDSILGIIFTIRDITHVVGFPMLIGAKESCTLKYPGEIVLRIDAPREQYYMASILYHVYIV